MLRTGFLLTRLYNFAVFNSKTFSRQVYIHRNLPTILIRHRPPNTVCLRHNSKIAICWNCNAPVSAALTCLQCKVLQRPDTERNYFQLFDINESFDVNYGNLTRQYRKLQTLLHPDKYANKSDAEKDISAEYSSLVNKAYDTLQTPLKRAIYMLESRGISIGEGDQTTDIKFLEEVIEISEEVATAEDPEHLIRLFNKNAIALTDIVHNIGKKFAEGNLEEVKCAVIKLRFYTSIKMQIDSLMRDRGIFT